MGGELQDGPTYIVEEVPDLEDQLAEDRQPLAGEQAYDGWAGLKEGQSLQGPQRVLASFAS